MTTAIRLIPCLDVARGRVVKGTRFVDLVDHGSAVDLAVRYEREGADEIVILGIALSTLSADERAEEERSLREIIAEIRRRVALPITVGGGVNDVSSALRFVEAGADRVSVNTAAVESPELITELSERLGAQSVVVAIDVAHGEVMTRGGRVATGREVGAWAAEVEARGTGEILLTSVDRDGTGSGFDVAAIRRVRGMVDLPIIASGGARTPADFMLALEAGASAVLAAGMFHRQEFSIQESKKILNERGWRMRPC